MAAILEIKNVTKTFRGGVRAVDDVTLAVEEGEFLTVLGPSGCGKTTTLRMVGGFEFPDAGRIVLDGRDVTDLPPYRRPVNMMFQDFALFPHLTVAQNIGYGLTIAGMKRREAAREVEEALHTIELLDKADRRPAELSIGQKQRVALARALIRRPKILLLDEPLSALDAKLRESMQVELKRLHDQIGLTFMMVTHDQTEALVMSDRIVVMDAGRIVQAGSPTDLYDRPETPYVANFLGTSNMVAGIVTGMADGTAQVSCGTADIRVALQDAAPAVGSRVTLSIRPEKVALGDGRALPAGFNSLSGRLRDVFFHGDSVRLAIDIGAERLLIVRRQLETGLHQMQLPPVGFGDWTLQWYVKAFTNPQLLAAVGNSLIVAVSALAICLVIGIPTALALSRYDFPGKTVFRRLVILPITLPGIITGVSMLSFFSQLGIELSLTTVIIGHGTAFAAIVITSVYARLERFDRRIIEASADLGVTPLRTFWKVTLPNIRTSIIGSSLLVFTLSFDEIPVTFFLTGRDNTLPMYIWSAIRRGITPEINAIGTVIIAVSTAILIQPAERRRER